ncbi:MAG TPA: lysophospholipid acyltransferase family protein [Myxococcaceae bacterium]|nr:lysophospholipid acyltransferase family protein [Myxococcaceae bacterium]
MPKSPVRKRGSAGQVSGRTPAGGEVVEGATPVGLTPGGGEVRRGRGGGSTPGGGEVHRVTTRPARAKKRKAPRTDADADEEPEPARVRSGTNGAARAASQGPGRAKTSRDAAADANRVVEIEPPQGPPPPATSPAASVIATALTSIQLARAVASQAFSSAGLGPVMKAASALSAAVKTSLGISAGTQVDAYGKDSELVETFQPISDFLYDRYWRVSVVGADHIPEGGAILVGNHSGAIPADGPVLRQALQRERPDLPEARWLVEDQIFDTAFLGTLFNRMGAVRACPENAFRLLEERRPVIVFPEGIQGIGKPFAQRYQLKRLGRGGFAKLAVRAGMPIIPVAIVGAEEAWPLLAKLPVRFLGLPYWPVTPPPLPAKWTVRFGEPLRPLATGGTAADDPGVVQPLVDGTRGAIEGMLRALLDERRSIFRG